MQLRDGSKYQLLVSRLFVKFRDTQLENDKDMHEAVVREVSGFIIHHSLSEIVLHFSATKI